ncbi:L-threonylcarbamoyladenylate synthase type 1 TsaC [Buchnera aphidicola (Therioaphis trifolii)]|uniref:Threonylcarbamoyl-AMP synthase n=1 Tax=Buchnera aphidicola (Therioaphis trifolii) TaxID=1241884 RepID=A0A4D6YBH6_9GAMM|nr:L-threonylcarbamoyladenylate synthase type 1 TsaC [Buchnera aphidicola (Therioaphis trifolii)]
MNKYFSKYIDILNNGNVIAYPSEAVFGLGCDPNNDNAIKNLLKLKNRKKNKGFILVASYYDQLLPYINENKLSNFQKKKLFLSWPGFITFLVPVKSNISHYITGYSDLIAVRVTSHPILNKLCFYFGRPIISTSANISGMKSAKTKKEVLNYFGVDFPVLDGKIGNFLYPSKIFNIVNGEYIRNDYISKI